MGILDDFKNLFWVKKAVTKSAAKKVMDSGKEITDDLTEKTAAAFDDVQEKASDLGRNIKEKAGDAFDDAKDFANDIMDDIWDKKDDIAGAGKSTAAGAGAVLKQTGEKFKEAAGGALEKAKKVGGEAMDDIVERTDDFWEKAEEVGGNLTNKAKDIANKTTERVQEGIDDMLEKSKALDQKIEEEIDKVDADRDGWADKPINEKLREKGSLTEDKDDFFSKASKYAEGDYGMGKPKIIPTDLSSIKPKTDDRKTFGFEDADGDGDELIDDAIIEEVEEAAEKVQEDIKEKKDSLSEQTKAMAAAVSAPKIIEDIVNDATEDILDLNDQENQTIDNEEE